jgi:hypothetical protein
MKKLLLSCYAHLLRMYPRTFREHYGREMQLFMRDYARDRGVLSFALLLFSDLMMSVPEQHYYEARMTHSRNQIASAVAGTLLLMGVALQIMYDMSNAQLRMGFVLVLVLATAFVLGAWLLSSLRRDRRNIRWLAPVVYAVAASLWLLVTPRHVEDINNIERAILSLGPVVGMGILFVPIVLAALPGRIAPVLMAVFIALSFGMIGAFYVPALLALLLVRFWPERTMPAMSAS